MVASFLFVQCAQKSHWDFEIGSRVLYSITKVIGYREFVKGWRQEIEKGGEKTPANLINEIPS